MLSLYQNDNEYQQHSHAIQLIAVKYRLKESVVRRLYEKHLRALLHKAKFRKYLPVLVSRRVRDLIRESRSLSG